MRPVLLIALWTATSAFAQTPLTPQQVRIVTPKGLGIITVEASDWTLERTTLYDHGTRAVLLLRNKSLDINASYILSNDETFDYSKESCKNDVLGAILRGPLKSATLKNKFNADRTLPTGQILDIGSYLVVKNEGITLNQQNVFGFIAQNHTCAEIHLSRAFFKEGEEHLFDSILNSFSFDPAYQPTAADYKAMAELLPPGMASLYAAGPPQASFTSNSLTPNQGLTFALPNHPGYLHMDAPNFVITELSAKTDGNEFGIRAKDTSLSGAEALGFLFLLNPSQPTATGCRDWMLDQEKSHGIKDRKVLKLFEDTSDSGVPIALVEYEQPKAQPSAHLVRRFFAAHGALCADISSTAKNATSIQAAASLDKTLVFDPERLPDFLAKFRYAQVLYDHHQYASAAPIFESALALVSTTDNPAKWRRVTTDQASMSYGMSGNVAESRAVNEAAILTDPDYPLYYYNLACADAESGDAAAARTHLEQAYARRANTLEGEHLPDAANDDSILRLKSNASFWAFVQSLPKQ